jgi:hypothetical protein
MELLLSSSNRILELCSNIYSEYFLWRYNSEEELRKSRLSLLLSAFIE